MNVYLIFDRKANTTRSVFTAPNDVQAIRSVVGATEQGQSDMGKYPAEFELRMVGVVNEDLGTVEGFDKYELLGSVALLVDASKGDK